MSDINEGLSEIFTELWHLDVNRCHPGEHYELDMQGAIYYRDGNADKAADKLFVWVDEEKVFAKPTFAKFRALLDNYESEVGVQEEVTNEELLENNEFVRECQSTELMQAAHKFLVSMGKSPSGQREFGQQLQKIWFGMYKRAKGRNRILDSSSFEHVFVGESRDSSTIGLHNWVQFYLLEQQGCIDYRGYFKRGTSDEASPRIMSLRFTTVDCAGGKPKGSSFIGVSPEFELAVYTIAYLCCDQPATRVRIDNYELDIVCHKMGSVLSSCYPQLAH